MAGISKMLFKSVRIYLGIISKCAYIRHQRGGSGSDIFVCMLRTTYVKPNGEVNWNIFSVWYGAIGWVIVNSFVFALGQAVLLVLALHRSSSDKVAIQGGETEPLLG